MIAGVAIRNRSIIVHLPKPNRHCHCFAHFARMLGVLGSSVGLGSNAKDQGFVTDKGLYLDREQVMRHVKRCGQKLIPHKDCKHKWSDPLFSEDVW